MQIGKDTTITYLGHATALIVTPGGKRILLDAWTTGNPKCPTEFKAIESLGILDFILLTHMHNDHCDDLVDIMKANPQAIVFCVAEAEDWLAGQGMNNVHGMHMGGSVHPIGTQLKISMTQAHHSSSYTNPDFSVVYGGNPVGFVIKMENGFTVYGAGDTCVFGDMSLIKRFHAPDLGLLPIGDNYTMGPEGAAYAAELLGLKYVVPIHYGTFDVLTGTPEMLKAALTASGREDIVVLTLTPGESVT